MYRSVIRRGAVLCTLAGLALVGSATLGGCGGSPESEGPLAEAALLPGPRFAGVDLVYALRRVAARSGMLLALDEINMGPGTPDLDRFRIDLDLEASAGRLPEGVD